MSQLAVAARGLLPAREARGAGTGRAIKARRRLFVPALHPASMPSFSAAIRTTRVADEDSAAIYVGSIDQEWSVLGKPHGGYLLACIVGAANAFQATPPPPPAPGRVPIQHLDPAHMMSQFLRAGLPGPYTLHVRLVKAGLNWTNLDVKMYQSVRPVSSSPFPP